MQGTVGLLIGFVVGALGLSGLGVALAEMMTHANPNASLISAAGLVVFVVSSLFLATMAYRS
jgi:hypothetical protein